jgi:hypothetical protein
MYDGDPRVHLVREAGDGKLTLCGLGLSGLLTEGVDQEGERCSDCATGAERGVPFIAAEILPLDIHAVPEPLDGSPVSAADVHDVAFAIPVHELERAAARVGAGGGES